MVKYFKYKIIDITPLASYGSKNYFSKKNLPGGVKLWYNYTILVNKNTGASAALLLRFLIQIARGTKCLIELK